MHVPHMHCGLWTYAFSARMWYGSKQLNAMFSNKPLFMTSKFSFPLRLLSYSTPLLVLLRELRSLWSHKTKAVKWPWQKLNEEAMQTQLLPSRFPSSVQGQWEKLPCGTANKDPLPFPPYQNPVSLFQRSHTQVDTWRGRSARLLSRDMCSSEQLLLRNTLQL